MSGLRGSLARAAAGAGCFLLAGCYSLAAVDPESITPPQRVRAQVSVAEAVRVGQVLGSPRQAVEGEVQERSAEGFYLLVPVSVVQEGMGLRTLHQRVFISRSELISVQRRELDRTRTGLALMGAAAVVAGVLALTFSGRSGGNTVVPPTDGPSDARMR